MLPPTLIINLIGMGERCLLVFFLKCRKFSTCLLVFAFLLFSEAVHDFQKASLVLEMSCLITRFSLAGSSMKAFLHIFELSENFRNDN